MMPGKVLDREKQELLEELREDGASKRSRERSERIARSRILAQAWISKSSAIQRAGRTGRVRPGRCWRLYGRKRHETALRDHELSEIHRQPLDAVVLNLRAMLQAPVAPLLASTLEPPDPAHVARSLAALRATGLLTAPVVGATRAADAAEGALTRTGGFVARIGVDLRLGRLVALGVDAAAHD